MTRVGDKITINKTVIRNRLTMAPTGMIHLLPRKKSPTTISVSLVSDSMITLRDAFRYPA